LLVAKRRRGLAQAVPTATLSGTIKDGKRRRLPGAT